MNRFKSFRRYALGRSPVRDNKIMCRAGGHTYKDNFRNALMIMLSIGLMAGKVISDFIGDASVSEVSGFIGGLIGILIGFYIGNIIRVWFSVRFNGLIGFFLGNLIGGLIGGFILVGGVYIGIVISGYIGDSVIDDATNESIFRWLLGVSLAIALCRTIRYDKWRLGYLGEIAVANELHKVRSQQWQIFHGFAYKCSFKQKCQQWIMVRISFGWKGTGSDIDHIIVCRNGVFCVKTKTERKNNNNGETTNNGDTIVFKENKICIKETKETLLECNQIQQITDNAEDLRKYINDSKVLNEKELESVIPIIAFPGWTVQGGEKVEPNETIVVCNHEQISNRIEGRIEKPLSEVDVNEICNLLKKETERDLFDN